jgi:hypothetical protein
VESLLGMVHLDSGFDAAQRAARHILEPVLQVLAVTPEDSVLVHPISRLQDSFGNFLSISTYDGTSFGENYAHPEAWDGYSWGKPGKHTVVARIECFGKSVMTTCAISKSGAISLACSSVLAVIHSDEALLRCIQEHSRDLAKALAKPAAQVFDE